MKWKVAEIVATPHQRIAGKARNLASPMEGRVSINALSYKKCPKEFFSSKIIGFVFLF